MSEPGTELVPATQPGSLPPERVREMFDRIARPYDTDEPRHDRRARPPLAGARRRGDRGWQRCQRAGRLLRDRRPHARARAPRGSGRRGDRGRLLAAHAGARPGQALPRRLHARAAAGGRRARAAAAGRPRRRRHRRLRRAQPRRPRARLPRAGAGRAAGRARRLPRDHDARVGAAGGLLPRLVRPAGARRRACRRPPRRLRVQLPAGLRAALPAARRARPTSCSSPGSRTSATRCSRAASSPCTSAR